MLYSARMEKLLFSKKESAQTLSVSPRMVDNLIASGVLRVKRVGRRVLVTGASLKGFVKSGSIGRSDEAIDR